MTQGSTDRIDKYNSLTNFKKASPRPLNLDYKTTDGLDYYTPDEHQTEHTPKNTFLD